MKIFKEPRAINYSLRNSVLSLCNSAKLNKSYFAKYRKVTAKFRQESLSKYLILIALASIWSIKLFAQDSPVKVMTFNIRLDNPADGANSWENRKSLVIQSLLRASPDILGMQEVLQQQLDYLGENLQGYGYIAAGRDDGKKAGESVPVFYKLDRFKLIDSGTFWLSPTPMDTGSVGWDAALTRICTWAKFRVLPSGLEFYFLNTHFDHMGQNARVESARLILDFISKQTNALPVILTGDFNCAPDDKPYSVLTGPEEGLHDVCQHLNSSESCLEGTFNGFGNEKDPQRIDMIFYKGRWKAGAYEVLKIKDENMFVSDHWPVSAELELRD